MTASVLLHRADPSSPPHSVGIDLCGGLACPLVESDAEQRAVAFDSIMRKVRARASNEQPATYRLWKQEQTNATGRWIYNAYVVEPSGQALQLNGFLVDAPASLVPKWNESLCGQGNCTTKPEAELSPLNAPAS